MLRFLLASCLLAAAFADASSDSPADRIIPPHVRQNFHANVERALGEQVTSEFKASHVYLAMSQHFGKTNVALPGFAKFFRKASEEERKHGLMLIDYLNLRGGQTLLESVPAPTKSSWTLEEALVDAIELERKVNRQLLNLHSTASDQNDVHVMDFLETNYLTEQVDSIKELADLLTRVRRVGSGLGEVIVDQQIQ